MTFPLKCISRVRRASSSLAVGLLLLSSATLQAQADALPPVTGVTFDGTTVTWDALAGATGYNVYRDFRYQTTVLATAYVPERTGEIRITAFDDDGNFSPLQIIEDDVVPTTNFVDVGSVDAGVSEPDNVFGIVYSDNAGEIFWDRVTSRSLQYSVSNNGVVLGTTDGTSFFINSLLSDAENRVSVVAVSSTGLESEPVSLLFDTRASELPAAATETDSATAPIVGITPPQNPVLDIYSQTAAELFWDRAPAADQVAFTEVFRDDVLLGTSPGTSFFDDTREPFTRYRYVLIAVSTNGERSARSIINPDPFDGSNETVVLDLLAGISDVATNNAHVLWGPVMSSLADEVPQDWTLVSTESSTVDGTVSTTRIYDCGRSGSATLVSTLADRLTTDMSFLDCDTPQAQYFGDVQVVSDGRGFESITYQQLEAYYEDIAYLEGNVTTSTSEDSRRVVYTNFDYGIETLMEDPDDDEYLSATMNQTVDAVAAGPDTFTTSLTVNASWTEGRNLAVTTESVFSRAEGSSGNYTSGALIAEFGDENLTLNADTGNEATWFAQISTSEGEESFVGNWSDLIRLP